MIAATIGCMTWEREYYVDDAFLFFPLNPVTLIYWGWYDSPSLTFLKRGHVTTCQKLTQHQKTLETPRQYRNRESVEEGKANSTGTPEGTSLPLHTIAKLISPAIIASHFHRCVWHHRPTVWGRGFQQLKCPCYKSAHCLENCENHRY